MAAVDFDLLSPHPAEHNLDRQILELAASLAISDLTPLHVVHAWEALAEGMLVSRGGVFPESSADYVEKERKRHRKELFRS